MTFSLLGRCRRTGQIGACTATADLAVGSRVLHARAGVGAILTQHRTDPRLGPRGLGLLASGCAAAETITALVASTRDHAWRQVAAMDASGQTAGFSGGRVEQPFAETAGDGCFALGNLLASNQVGEAMIQSFERSADHELTDRLLGALRAAQTAGGERSPVRSAAVLVVSDQPFPLVDLRVDDHADPIAELIRVWDLYRPRASEFVERALHPDKVPV